jgi:L-lactate dehydrogenase complex protein LldF
VTAAHTRAGAAAPLHFVDPRRFKANAREAVDDAQLRISFRAAMDFLQARRASHFGDGAAFEALRRVGESIRRYSLAKLPELLEQLEARLVERGVQVHWARTPDEANEIFLALARRHGATQMVKGTRSPASRRWSSASSTCCRCSRC